MITAKAFKFLAGQIMGGYSSKLADHNLDWAKLVLIKWCQLDRRPSLQPTHYPTTPTCISVLCRVDQWKLVLYKQNLFYILDMLYVVI